MDEGRILGIDLGRRRIGLALSDPLGMFATGLETLEITGKTDVVAELATICTQREVVKIVLGLPRNMDGSEGEKAEESYQLGKRLEARLGLPVVYVDERLTSVIANNTLREQGIKASRNKGLVDQTAAKLILQSYLDGKK